MHSAGATNSLSPEQTLEIAGRLAAQFPKALVLLHGSLGAGKTLFARGFAAGLGIKGNVSSPSYTLMNEYRAEGHSMFHLDLYRVNCFEEVIDIGLFDILNAGQPCLIEWAERVVELERLPHLAVRIACYDEDHEHHRQISWQWQEGQKEPGMKYLFIDASENTTFAQTGDLNGFNHKVFPTDRNFAARITLICDEMLKDAGIAFNDLDLLAVCTGPGSLTGLRVAAAFLRTAAMLARKPLAGINLFEWSLQTLADQGISGPVRLVMPTLIDKAFASAACLPDLNPGQPELIDRTEAGSQPDTYGVRFEAPGVVKLQPDPAALHKLLITGNLKAASGLHEILNILPMYVIPSQAERKFKEAT